MMLPGGHLQQCKLAQIIIQKIAKVGSKFCQVQNKLSQFCLMVLNFAKSGRTVDSSNLIKLKLSKLKKVAIKPGHRFSIPTYLWLKVMNEILITVTMIRKGCSK